MQGPDLVAMASKQPPPAVKMPRRRVARKPVAQVLSSVGTLSAVRKLVSQQTAQDEDGGDGIGRSPARESSDYATENRSKAFQDSAAASTPHPTDIPNTSIPPSNVVSARDEASQVNMDLEASLDRSIKDDQRVSKQTILNDSSTPTTFLAPHPEHKSKPHPYTETRRVMERQRVRDVPPICSAARFNDVGACKALLQGQMKEPVNGSLPGSASESKFAKSHTTSCVVVNNPPKLQLVDSAGFGPLHWAALEGSFEVCKLLLETWQGHQRAQDQDAGVVTAFDPNKSCSAFPRCTPLMVACGEGHAEVSRLLFDASGPRRSSEARDDMGFTAVDYAVRCGHTDLAEYLQVSSFLLMATPSPRELETTIETATTQPLHHRPQQSKLQQQVPSHLSCARCVC